MRRGSIRVVSWAARAKQQGDRRERGQRVIAVAPSYIHNVWPTRLGTPGR